MKKFTIAFLLFSSVLLAFSQNDSIPELVTDRPDATESSSTVPLGSLQIESGFIFTNTKSQEVQSDEYNLGSTLVRYGLLENFELRVGTYYGKLTEHYESIDVDSTFSGLGAVSGGFKVFICEEDGWIPEFSAMTEVTLRHIGHRKMHPTYSYFVTRLTASHTLSKKFSSGYNFGFGLDGEDPDGFFIYSAVIGYSITPSIGAFVEVFGEFDNADFPHSVLDGGLTFLIRHNLQLDVSAGISLSSQSDIYFLNTGFSWRIPR